MKSLEKQIHEYGQTIILIIPFLSFGEVSKIKLVNILSIKETVCDVTLIGLITKGIIEAFKFLNFCCSLNKLG